MWDLVFHCTCGHSGASVWTSFSVSLSDLVLIIVEGVSLLVAAPYCSFPWGLYVPINRVIFTQLLPCYSCGGSLVIRTSVWDLVPYQWSLVIRTSCVGLAAPPYCEPLWVLYVGPGAQLLWVSPVSPPCLYEASVGSLWNLCGASMCNLVLSTQLLPRYSCGGVLITTLL